MVPTKSLWYFFIIKKKHQQQYILLVYFQNIYGVYYSMFCIKKKCFEILLKNKMNQKAANLLTPYTQGAGCYYHQATLKPHFCSFYRKSNLITHATLVCIYLQTKNITYLCYHKNNNKKKNDTFYFRWYYKYTIISLPVKRKHYSKCHEVCQSSGPDLAHCQTPCHMQRPQEWSEIDTGTQREAWRRRRRFKRCYWLMIKTP